MKPSILGILYHDIPEIIEHINETLAQIDHGGLTNNLTRFFNDENLLPNTIDFWTDDTVFYTQSGLFRMRVILKYGKVYQFYLNIPNDNSQFQSQGYFGKILEEIF